MDFPKPHKIDEDVNLYIIKTNKFKTFSIHVFIHRPLNEDVTKNALIPLVLRRGSQDIPNMQLLSKHLEELYGASFDCGIGKKGERHILRFHFEGIHNKAFEANEIFEKGVKFMTDIILHPILENGKFKSEYVNQEKDNLRKIIESKVNDKSRYVMEKCIEEMCENEPYRIYEYGNINKLNTINQDNLYNYYLELLQESPIDIFVIGDMNEEDILNKIKSEFIIDRKNIKRIEKSVETAEIKEIKRVEEALDISQGKLCMGFRTNIDYEDPEYFPLIIFNSILGGGTTSKLFINVREKESLAYSINSRIDKFKGLMFITAGIDFENFEKAIDIIFKQIDEIKNGSISDSEYKAAIGSLSTSIKSLSDSHLYIVDFFLSQIISNSEYTIDEVIDKIQKVNKDDIPKIADKIKPDTIYFLKGK
jgi:predicted Zn-dependent peptidase